MFIRQTPLWCAKEAFQESRALPAGDACCRVLRTMDASQVLDLICQYLTERGFRTTLDALQKESNHAFDDLRNARYASGSLVRMLSEHAEMTADRPVDAVDLIDKEIFTASACASLFCAQLQRALPDAHSKNVLSVAFVHSDDALLASTGTDRVLQVTDVLTGEPMARVNTAEFHSAPVLCMAAHPKLEHVLLVGSMDGRHTLVDWRTGAVVQAFDSHTKYIVCCRFHPSGQLFAVASHDRDVTVYAAVAGSGMLRYELVRRLSFQTPVESLAFAPLCDAADAVLGPAGADRVRDGDWLLVTPREDHRVHAFALPTYEFAELNMNANGDAFVSFSVLDIATSPDGRFACVATDKSRFIVFHLRPWRLLRNLYGIPSTEMGQTRCVWDPTSTFVYGCAPDRAAYVFHVGTERLVARLEGHTNIVRNVAHHPTRTLFSTASFDHTVRVWEAGDTAAATSSSTAGSSALPAAAK